MIFTARRTTLPAVFLFQSVFFPLLGELLLFVLFMLTSVMFFVDIVSDLSDILLRRFTLGEECGMLDII